MRSPDTQQAETAQVAYLSLLKSKGAATSLINQRKHFLRFLLSAIDAQAHRYLSDIDAGYRKAVDVVLSKFPDSQHVEIISTAREFYPFWIGDLKTIARLNAAEALTTEAVPVDISGGLMDMFERMDRDPWSQSLPESLARYLDALAAQGAEDAVLDIRERLLKMLLFTIRHVEPTPAAYRSAVDGLLQLFSKEETRNLFTDVAREFFYFWTGFHSAQPLSE